jgi:hypothetical protein
MYLQNKEAEPVQNGPALFIIYIPHFAGSLSLLISCNFLYSNEYKEDFYELKCESNWRNEVNDD